ncbi:hypothetical protein [Klebsiella sp. BIGb0407]|uniref:hypothetical protein n=1 Tax=Klebsiella sp. BIGb0407 TaxID=2940603 RepID=UPI0021696DC0|nr:hypothetical protein [Klebsiella sp. BIGb0407]MCS3429878.1 hypothetical protein [Klebsiella sp. BIGb0407]
MSNINFDDAISTAYTNAEKLLPEAKNFTLEEVLLSDDQKLFEVTLSYTIPGLSSASNIPNLNINPLMRRLVDRKSYRVFLVDANTGVFRGFRMLNK